MSESSAEILMIFRQLTPKHQIELLSHLKSVHAKDSFGRKKISFGIINETQPHAHLQDYPCKNS
jgi:hypothetical protein